MSPARGGRPAEPSAHGGGGGDTQRPRSEQKLLLGRRAEPRSAETQEGLQEHKRGGMHLSYEATPSPNLTDSQEEIKTPESPNLSSTSTSPWSGDPTCTGIPPRDFGRVLSQAGYRDATLERGDALLGSGTASGRSLGTKRDPAARRGHRPHGGLCFGAFPCFQAKSKRRRDFGQRQQHFC